MKKIYMKPAMKVVDVVVETVLANSPGVSTSPADGSTPLVKGDVNMGIDFDEMNGTDIVRKNPWDSQW